jgi:flagellar M-ring protein FliF
MDENSPLAFVYRIPGLRQILLLGGLALAISAGITAAFWMREPSYTMLYSNISGDEAGQIVEVLTSTDIRHRLDPKTGAILVPAEQVHEARLKLAAQGLPRGAGFGLEIMQQDAGFATSQFMENARYHHALETELGRTIGKLRPVQSARVHLAVPDATVFLRKSRQPSASVLVNLYPGRELDKPQVASIVHLVASSIPGLESDRVTVVDQQGRLLNAPGDAEETGLSTQQFEYVQKIENSYADRIASLLTPILGPDRVRATVTAEMDFTVREETREEYDPDNTAVRSEQVAEDRRTDGLNGGIPGALSNTPPAPVVAVNAANPNPPAAAAPASPAPAEGATQAATMAPAANAVNESMRRTRNFEVDRVLSHTRNPTGQIERLSVAVLVDHKHITSEDGEVTTQPLSQQELDEVTRLVKEAVGFSEQRGDTVSISNVSFFEPPAEEEPEEPGLFDSPALFETGRTVLAGLLVLALAFVVIRPIMRGLGVGTGAGSAPALAGGALGGPAVMTGGAPVGQPRAALSFDDRISVARQLADKNPERVAQIVKSWMQSDE